MHPRPRSDYAERPDAKPHVTSHDAGLRTRTPHNSLTRHEHQPAPPVERSSRGHEVALAEKLPGPTECLVESAPKRCADAVFVGVSRRIESVRPVGGGSQIGSTPVIMSAISRPIAGAWDMPPRCPRPPPRRSGRSEPGR